MGSFKVFQFETVDDINPRTGQTRTKCIIFLFDKLLQTVWSSLKIVIDSFCASELLQLSIH